jgi:MFS family permease
MNKSIKDISSAARKSPFFYGYIIVAAALVIDLVLAGVHFTFGVFFKPVSAEFGWSSAATSGAFTFYNIFQGALFILTGKLCDKIGPRLILVGTAIFLGLGYFLMSRIESISQLYLFYGVIVAFGMSGGFVPLMSTIARWFKKRRGMMTGLVLAGGGLGQATFPPLATWLISRFEWREAYIILSVSVFVIIGVLAQLLRRDPEQKGQKPYGDGEDLVERQDVEPKGFTLLQAVSTRQFWIYGLAIVCGQFAIGIMVVHSVPYGIDIGMSPEAAAGIVTTFAAVGTSARVISGFVLDRTGCKRVLAVASLLIGVGLSGIAAIQTTWSLYLFAAVFGFGFGALASTMSPLSAELFGMTSHGVIFGVITFGGTIGGGIGPLVAGKIFDITGVYTNAFITGAIFSFCAFVLTLFLKPVKTHIDI